MTASHGPAAASRARSAACVRSPRIAWTPATSAPDRPRLNVMTSHPCLRAASDGVTDEPGTAEDQQAHVNSCHLDYERWHTRPGRDADGRTLDADGERTAANRLD